MRTVGKLAWVELKLFAREPLTVVFALALPVVLLLVLGSVFGSTPEEGVYRNVSPLAYYVPAYVALVIASVTIISLPTHLAGNRERGVLKRFHASGVGAWEVLASQVAVALVLAVVSSSVLVAVAVPVYDFPAPGSPGMLAAGFLLCAVAFAALGVLVGAVLPTARAAQAVGILVWFLLLFLGGAGPPREVLNTALQGVQDATPLWHAVRVMQDAWLGLDAGLSWGVVAGLLVVGAVFAVALFRWE
jgi:ABC-2 type transport system permease protein